MRAKSLRLYLTLCGLMGCSLPGSSFHGISQTRILEWVVMPSSRDLSDPGIKPRAPVAPALQADSLPLGQQGSLSYGSVQFSSVAQLSLTLGHLVDCSMPGFPVHHQLPSLLKLMSSESVIPSNHLILCRSRLLLSSIFSRIKVFSNELVLHIRWPKY